MTPKSGLGALPVLPRPTVTLLLECLARWGVFVGDWLFVCLWTPPDTQSYFVYPCAPGA